MRIRNLIFFCFLVIFFLITFFNYLIDYSNLFMCNVFIEQLNFCCNLPTYYYSVPMGPNYVPPVVPPAVPVPPLANGSFFYNCVFTVQDTLESVDTITLLKLFSTGFTAIMVIQVTIYYYF